MKKLYNLNEIFNRRSGSIILKVSDLKMTHHPNSKSIKGMERYLQDVLDQKADKIRPIRIRIRKKDNQFEIINGHKTVEALKKMNFPTVYADIETVPQKLLRWLEDGRWIPVLAGLLVGFFSRELSRIYKRDFLVSLGFCLPMLTWFVMIGLNLEWLMKCDWQERILKSVKILALNFLAYYASFAIIFLIQLFIFIIS
ncbi:MAG: hypothetical protein PHG05_01750 [Candidatus Nanoarchaeia archaeon]|nr:hypothetical protein [Candidatus Nanoarchaeia archaeon]